MSTNLAETSITIDDCVFVVEAGRMKEKGFDSTKNMESLDTVWVSQANALQVGLVFNIQWCTDLVEKLVTAKFSTKSNFKILFISFLE